MQTIGRIAVEDHLTPFIDAFNAMRPPAEMVPMMQDHNVMTVVRGEGPAGPFVRILPTADLLRSMAATLDEIERLLDVEA